MWSFFGTILTFILRTVFNQIAKKKLSDAEFIRYIVAHQKMRSRAGDAALEWEDALEQAKKELESDLKK